MQTVVKKNKVLHSELSYTVNGALFKVRRELGQFKTEQQYCDAIEHELKSLGISHQREKVLPQSFESEARGRSKVDFLIENKIILEVKAKPFVTKEDYYQVKRYLSVLNLELGILVNMRRHYVQPKRILNMPEAKRS